MRNLVFAALAATALAGSTPTVAVTPSEHEEMVQLLRGFVAVLEQDIEEFKASMLKANQEQMDRNSAVNEQLKVVQEQMVRDNTTITEQLKAIKEQMDRLTAKDSERQLRPKTSAPTPPSIATSTGKQVPKVSSPQTRAQPQGPVRGPSQ